MKAAMVRTSSVPVQPSIPSGSPKVSLSAHDSVAGLFSGEKSAVPSPQMCLHFESNRRRGIRRVFSESDLIRLKSEVFGGLTGYGSRSFPAKIPEEEYFSESDVDGDGSLILKSKGVKRVNPAGNWPEIGIPLEELGFSGGGFGINSGGRGGGSDEGKNGAFSGGNGDPSKIGAYYQKMLKSNPNDPLLLRNYGKFLHEVEKDTVRADEYYGRAILASPGDGEVLSLYGKLIWETQRDEERAKSYFNQAIKASPHDCMVLGSYAQFMWDAKENEDGEEEFNNRASAAVEVPLATAAAAF